MTRVVNRRNEPYDVYIGRGSPFGNPFSHLDHSKAKFKVATRAEAIAQYRIWFADQLKSPEFAAKVMTLKDKTLGCYCKPLPCHGDVIAEWLDKMPSPR